MPRSSLLSRKKVSASSIRTVGDHFSTARNTAAGVMFAAGNGRGTTAPRKVRTVVLPHSGVGLVMPSTGEMSKQSCAWENRTERASASAAPSGNTRCDFAVSHSTLSRSATSTGSSQGSGSWRNKFAHLGLLPICALPALAVFLVKKRERRAERFGECPSPLAILDWAHVGQFRELLIIARRRPCDSIGASNILVSLQLPERHYLSLITHAASSSGTSTSSSAVGIGGGIQFHTRSA